MSTFVYRIFTTVAEQQSFVKAAEYLHLTPPAVSYSIAKLEKEYGLNLFERTRNGAKLTSDGYKLLPFVRNILGAEERLNQEISMTKNLDTGRVCIGTIYSVCVNWIPDIVASFSALYPGIDINICQGGYADSVEWLRTGFVDMSFVSEASEVDFIDTIPLFRDRIMCVTPKTFRPINRTYVSIDDLQEQSFVYQRFGYDSETNDFLQKHEIKVHNKHLVESDPALIALAECGLGICLVAELVLKKIIHNAAIYPLHPVTYRTIELATMKNKPLSIAATRMKNHIIDYVSTMTGAMSE